MAEIVNSGMPPHVRFARQHVLPDHFPKANAFRELDHEFYGYPDTLADLLKKYDAL